MIQGQALVPQRRYIPSRRQGLLSDTTTCGPITFACGSGMDGIPLARVMEENLDDLIGKNDLAFENPMRSLMALRLEVSFVSTYLEKMWQILCNLQWPGYESWTGRLSTNDWRTTRRPITKGKLVLQVAKAVRDFIQVRLQVFPILWYLVLHAYHRATSTSPLNLSTRDGGSDQASSKSRTSYSSVCYVSLRPHSSQNFG